MGTTTEKRISSTQAKDAIYKAHSISSSAREIDNVVVGTWDTKIVNKLKSSSVINIIGDSITYGVGVVNKNKSWNVGFKQLLLDNCGITNKGFLTVNNVVPWLIDQNITFNNSTYWSKNFINQKSINSFSYDCSTANETISIYSYDYEQTTANLVYVKPLIDSVYEVYVNDVLKTTITETANGSQSIVESSSISLGNSGNTIKIKLISGTISISGVIYKNGSTKIINDYSTGSRRARYVNGEVLTSMLSADACVYALGYNDIQGGSTAAEITETEGYLETLAQHFKDNNKLFIFINFAWYTTDDNNWVLQKLNSTFGDYENYHVINIAETILDNNGDVASSSYRINILKEWADAAHPNDYGSERILRLISKKIFNEFNSKDIKYIDYINNSIVSNRSTIDGTCSYSLILGDGNDGKVAYSTILGINAKAINSATVVGQSIYSAKIRQFQSQMRSTTTTDATETYTRDTSVSAFVNVHPNTILTVKGYLIATDTVNGLHKEFEVDCKMININGVTSLVTATGYPTNGLTATKGTLSVTARIVPIDNRYTLRVTGLASTIIYWHALLDTVEITTGY